MSRDPQVSRHLSWLTLLLAILATFSFHTDTYGPQAHQGGTTHGVVVIDTDDDPWDGPSVEDDVPGDDTVAAVGRQIPRPQNPRPRPVLGFSQRPASGQDAPAGQLPAPAGAALLTRLGISLT